MNKLLLLLCFTFSVAAHEIPFRELRVRIFTSPSWCSNCKNLQGHLQKTQQEKFLRVQSEGKFRTIIVETYDPDNLSKEQLSELGYSGEGIPEYVVVKNKTEVVARDAGYVAGTDFTAEVIRLLHKSDG